MSDDTKRLSDKIQLLMSRHPHVDIMPLLFRITPIKDATKGLHQFSNKELERYIDIALGH